MDAPNAPAPLETGRSDVGPRTFEAKAWCLGERIEVRDLERAATLAPSPLTLRAGEHGRAVVFRFGAVVLVGMSPIEAAAFLESLRPFVREPFAEPESETAEITIDPDRGDRVDASGVVVLRESDVARVQVVADVLAKSAVLTHYEESVAGAFDRIEYMARGLQGARLMRGVELLREIGNVLLIQTRTVGRVEVTEKPETTWDAPELDRLYERLAGEYELRDRDLALSRKLDLASRTAETYLDLVHNRRSLRVEWYIVILIAVEIVLILYDIFGAH